MLVLYTNSVSAHQLPLAREIVKRVGEENFRYVYTGENLQNGSQEVAAAEPWVVRESSAGQLLENCEVLLCGGLRPFDLFARRTEKGLKTLYQSERWFKPVGREVEIGGRGRRWCLRFSVPGWVRMLVPGYRRMAKRFVRWANGDANARVLAIGPWSKRDFLRMGVRCEKLVDWGYFVEPSAENIGVKRDAVSKELKVLYIGRLLKLKRVDTIIRAVARANEELRMKDEGSNEGLRIKDEGSNEGLRIKDEGSNEGLRIKDEGCRCVNLTIVGSGPEEERLKALAEKLVSKSAILHPSSFIFHPSVPISEVRSVMRSHDVVVFASDGRDGWGAVVSEALSEGVPVIGTYETGAAAAMLPAGQLFHAGDWKALARKLVVVGSCSGSEGLVSAIPREYTPEGAVERLFKVI